MQAFRKVELNLPGTLYLHSMPGFKEPFSTCSDALKEAAIHHILCLTPTEEIEERSPEYAEAIQQGTLPCELVHFPMGIGGIPDNKNAFLDLAKASALQLQNGENLLIHCKGGVGRTGTLASCIVAALNQPLSLVTDAGGKAESEEQQALIASLKSM